MAGTSSLRALLERVASGELSVERGAELLAAESDLGFARLDLDRERRTGTPEAVFGEGKSPDQLVAIVDELVRRRGRALVTRVDGESASLLSQRHSEGRYEPLGRVWSVGGLAQERAAGSVAVVSAGTADGGVFAEAATVAEWLGMSVERHADVGVAGLHRLLGRLEAIREARVVIAVAGMDGALPTVLAGLVPAPVVAVPTSVGYGAGSGGITPLLTMLGGCAPGLAVVNIDNGFGAAVLAHRILRSPP